MTLEASLVLPVFLLLFMNLMSIIEVYRIHSNIAETLWENGRKTAQYHYLETMAGKITGIADASVLTDMAASFSDKKQIARNLEPYPVWKKLVSGGESGFLVLENTTDHGIITIDCTYSIHPLFPFLTPVSKTIQNHYYGHSWTGYELGAELHDGDSEEEYVYITETGTVYHRNRGCSYLNPSIQAIAASELESRRNESGAIYYACPLCGGGAAGGICYITNYGTNYHASSACSGLKRTIYTVKLSEVGKRGPCSKCGG